MYELPHYERNVDGHCRSNFRPLAFQVPGPHREHGPAVEATRGCPDLYAGGVETTCGVLALSSEVTARSYCAKGWPLRPASAGWRPRGAVLRRTRLIVAILY